MWVKGGFFFLMEDFMVCLYVYENDAVRGEIGGSEREKS